MKIIHTKQNNFQFSTYFADALLFIATFEATVLILVIAGGAR